MTLKTRARSMSEAGDKVMTMIIAYELRTHAKSGWRIEAVFDESILALDAAKRLQGRNPALPILVVEETYDQMKEQVRERIVFRSDYQGDTIKVQPKRRKLDGGAGAEDVRAETRVERGPMNPVLKKALMYMALLLAIGAYFGLEFIK